MRLFVLANGYITTTEMVKRNSTNKSILPSVDEAIHKFPYLVQMVNEMSTLFKCRELTTIDECIASDRVSLVSADLQAHLAYSYILAMAIWPLAEGKIRNIRARQEV